MRFVVALAALASVLSFAQAQANDETYSCARDDMIRTVSVVMQPASGRACEVRYQKSSTGEAPQVLWHADTEASFCSGQAEALVDRLSGAGWICAEGDSRSASASLPEPMAAAVEVGAPAGVTAATSPQSARDPNGSRKPNAPVFRLRPTIH